MERKQIRLGIIGYGEVGSTLGQGFRDEGLIDIAAYDKYAFDGPFSQLIQSRAAISAYQARIGQEPTGVPSLALLRSLG